MRTRKRVTVANSVRYAAMTTGLAAMLATGQAETVGARALGEIIPEADRSLADLIADAQCEWVALESFYERIVAESGRKHTLDESELSQARSRIDTLKSKMDTLKAEFASQKGSLSINRLDDPKCARQLLANLEKSICAAQKRIAKMQKRLSAKSAKAGPLEKSADAGEDLLGEALGSLVGKTKRSKKARKKAAKRAASRHRVQNDFEVTQKTAVRGGEKKSSKRARKKAARKKAVKKVVRKAAPGGNGPQAKEARNSYLALAATGKVPDADAFYFETLALELSGDVVAHADLGLFSSKSKAVAAAGDGEQGCLEVSTVGSAPAAAFVSLCGRQNAVRGGFDAYMLTPQGARSVTHLPGVTVAEFRMSIQGGSVQFEVRDAEVRGTWTFVDSVSKPPDPLTFSIGAAFMGAGDEIGFDNLLVEAQFED